MLQKSNTKRQGIKIKRWFKQEKRNRFAKDFEGEVTPKPETETQSEQNQSLAKH